MHQKMNGHAVNMFSIGETYWDNEIMKPFVKCSLDECPKESWCRGWCEGHYKRWRRHGDPRGGRLVLKHLPEAERFWARVDKAGPMPEVRPDLGPCWLWTAGKTGSGYGAFYGDDGKQVGAHRWVYLHYRGDLGEGYVPDHLCENKACVNPGHLQAATGWENVVRGGGFLGVANASKARCINDHSLSGDNVRIDAKGRRHCRACARDEAQRKRDREHATVPLRVRTKALCGTRGGYQRHRRNGEDPCTECSTAYKTAQRDYYVRSKWSLGAGGGQ